MTPEQAQQLINDAVRLAKADPETAIQKLAAVLLAGVVVDAEGQPYPIKGGN